MKSKLCFLGLSVVWSLLMFAGCDHKPMEASDFTKADSLTETYLALQDTMLEVWNTMIHDDNRKIKAMHSLLHELTVSLPEKRDELEGYQARLDELLTLRYDQHSMWDADIVTQYDFASSSLVTELVALAEAQTQFPYNTTLQKLVDSIRAADERVMNYRLEYDEVASRLNGFIERNKNQLDDIDLDSFLEKKPLFQMAAE